ncbi:MAG TPA: glutamyl-tRNA reductase [Bryobacteraceae bacterium]|nr:glutamyl-tRNA reductase [Bryobacteraceae bacterium]
MTFLITGLNHKTAPVEVRERLAFDQNALGAALADLRRHDVVAEGLILSTCNRVEIAVLAPNGTDPQAEVDGFLSRARNVTVESIAPHLYHYRDEAAIQHLFRVAASLDSMVVGEPQILGQLKQAYAAAKAHGALAGNLEAILTRAFSVAKRVRSETGIGESAVSVSYAAVELAREIFGTLADKKVMIVGAGKMSELAARHLNRSGASQIYVTNRTLERAQEMADLFEGKIVEYDRFLATLPEMDIVITSSGAPFYIIRRQDMRRVIEARKNRPMFLIDIAVPRNIEPSVNEIDNVFLYDIDDLQRVVETNVGERKKRAEAAERIIADEVERMVARLRARDVVPTIVCLQDQLEAWRQAELGRIRGKLGQLTPQQEEAVDALTRGLVNKIAHGPISEMRRQAGQPEGVQFIDVIRRVFRLDQ